MDNDVPYSSYSLDFFGSLGRLFAGVGPGEGAAVAGSVFASIVHWLWVLWGAFTALSLLASAILFAGIIYTYFRAAQLAEAQEHFILAAERAYRELNGSRTKNWRWEEVESHIDSESPNDWKLAIIDADVMLYETLESAGYTGTSIGDKLKSANTKSFTTLEQAWNAHKVRNQIAHGGADFVLTKKIAQDTINQYKMVFSEFGVI